MLILVIFCVSVPIHAQRERLARPTNLKFSGNTLTWDAVPNVWRYNVRWRAQGANWQSATVSRRRSHYRFTLLPTDVKITMRVRPSSAPIPTIVAAYGVITSH